MSKVSCARSKTECKTCRSNENGWCTFVEKNIDDLYRQWASSRRSRAKRKLRENASFFTKETIGDIVKYANIIESSGKESKEQIDAMNNLNAIFYNWKTVDTEFLDD